MTEKEIEDLLEVAKEVNSFRLQATGTICPICMGHLRGDVKSTILLIVFFMVLFIVPLVPFLM